MAKKYHLEIPDSNVSKREIKKNGFSETIRRISYKEHGMTLRNHKENFKTTELPKKDLQVLSNIFLQISTLENQKIKSHLSKIENLGFELVSLVSDNQSIANFKIETKKFEEFEEKLEEYIVTPENRFKTYFTAIEDIRPIPNETKIAIDIDIDSEETYDIIINFFSGIKISELRSLKILLEKEFHTNNYEFNFCSLSNKIITVKSQLNGNQIRKLLNDFNSIREIQLNHQYHISRSSKGSNIGDNIKIEDPISSSAICVIDSGITSNGKVLPPFVRGVVDSYLPSNSISPEYTHGTFVASRCIFGDDIDVQLSQNILRPYCYVIDVPVFGIDTKGECLNSDDFFLANAIAEVVESLYQTTKVYNLSLGSESPLRDNEKSQLGQVLDYLSKEYDVLFVISSGNINSCHGNYPDEHFSNESSRIGSPAESLLGLTVGSIAKTDYEGSLTRKNYLSPFSRIGPGTDGGVKPELVAHGGNLLTPYNYLDRIATCGLFEDGASISYNIGTSFSAPIVSRYAQMLFDYYPFAKTNLVKALLIHFSDRREVFDNIDYDFKYGGFGEPNINNALYAKDSATYIYQGKLDTKNYDYVKFHIPTQFTDPNIETKLKLKITIVYNPEVDINNHHEYSKSRLSIKMEKNTASGLKEIAISDSNVYTRQWSPILQFEKCFSKNFEAGEWEIALRLYTRGIIEEDYIQDYAIIIEVIDELRNINVYDLIKHDSELNYNSYEDEIIDINYA